MWSEKCTLVLACFIPICLNLFHTIFGCSRSVWIIHHLQDGLQRCCLMLLHLFARFGDLVKAYLKVTVCIGFCRLSEITPASNYIFFYGGKVPKIIHGNPWYPQMWSAKCTFLLACFIPIYFNLFHTIFGCSRSVWIIHHLQDGLQRCCLMLLHLFARFGDLVKAYLKVTVCMRFCRLLDISTASNYIFPMEARCHDNPFPLLLNPRQVLKLGSVSKFWKIWGWPIWLLMDPL